MNSGRPKLKIPLEPIDIIAEIISISGLILLTVYTFMIYNDMPDTIPTHFNAQGEADGFGDKITLWWLVAIGIVLYISLSVLNRYPHIHNYNVNITEENAFKNYRFSTRILRFVNVFMVLLFIFIQYAIVSNVNDNSNLLGSWFVPIIIGVSVTLPIFIVIQNRKMNKS